MARRIGGLTCILAALASSVTASDHTGDFQFRTPIAVTNVKIESGTGNTIESGTIVMVDGRIVDVGEEVVIPADAERIDGTGLIAYPGFIDAQAHLGIPKWKRTPDERRRVEDVNPDTRQGSLPATRFANRRGIRPEVRAAELYVPDSKQLNAHRRLGFTTLLIAPRDGIFSGSSDLISLSAGPVRRVVTAANVAQHAGFTAGEEGTYPRSALGITAQFRQVMIDAQRHIKEKKFAARHPTSARRAPDDAALDALQSVLARTQPIIIEANTETEIHRALGLAAEFNLDLIISGGKEAWRVIDRLRAARVSVIVSLKFPEEPEYGRKHKAKKTDPPDDNNDDEDRPKEAKASGKKVYEPVKLGKERRRLWEEYVTNIIRLHEAGVPIALRTRDFEKPDELFKNLRMVIERGLPERAAVDALTFMPAAILHVDDRLGRIAPGYLANLTLRTGSLADKKAKVKYVFIDGKKFEPTAEKKDHDRSDHKADEDDHENKQENESADSETESTSDAASLDAPTWAVEIEADRVPITRTGGNVLIRNATIIPVSSPTRSNASILIRNGKIEAIGSDIAVTADVTVIDGTGRFVIPGFVDAHSHLGVEAVNEWPMAISAEVRIADVVRPRHVGLYRAVAGGTTTHHVMHGSANPIGGQNAILKIKYGRPASEMFIPDAPPTIKFALGENVTHANRRREPRKRFPTTRMGVEAVIRTALETAKAYQQSWDNYERNTPSGVDALPPRRDLRLEALADILAGDLTVHAHCYRSDEILRLLAVAEEYGFRIGTLQHVLEGYRIAPEIARHGCGASTFSNHWAYKIEAYQAVPHNAALMTEHGINSSINSDSPNTIRFLGQEAAKSIRWGGLSENETLRLVTLNPAMQLQIDDRVGSLEVGKDGDIAIFNGHPLNTFSKCVMTLIDGEVFFEDPRPDPTEPADTLVLPGSVDRTIPETPHRAYAIVGATVHTISGPTLENATVVIVENLIHAVGVNASVPAGAGVIDGKGLHVYPGLIDAHSQLGLEEIEMVRATRDQRDLADFAPHLRAASAVHPHSVHFRITRSAGTTTTLTVPTGGRIAGQSAVIHLDGWTTPEMLINDAFGLHMTVPSLGIHLPEDKKKKKEITDKHEKAVKALDTFITRAKHYAKVKALAVDDPHVTYTIDLKLDAMVPYVRGDKPVVFRANKYKAILDAIEFAQKHELRCVLLGAKEAWKLVDVLAQKDIAVILSGPLSYPSNKFEPWDSVYRCAAALDRAGVRFCFGSGSVANAYDLGTMAGMAVAHGLPRERAERALTLSAAEILGIDDRVGSIETGKRADIIVTTDTPLQTVSQVTHMFIDGRPIELTSMHTENTEKFRNRPAPHLPPAPILRGPPSLTRH